MNKNWPACFLFVVVVLTCGVTSAAPDPLPKITGQEPPAMAPYAPNDPMPKVSLPMHNQPFNNGREVAETFLSLLSRGYHPGMEHLTGGSIPGDDRAFERAWQLMGPDRPTYDVFRANWSDTVRVGIIQFESVSSTRFFFEFEQLAWLRNSWNVSYHMGWMDACPTGDDWRVCSLKLGTEPLIVHNIGGHQGWSHSLKAILFIGWRGSEKDWMVTSIDYERRTATVRLRHRTTGEEVTRRFTRIQEGSWLEITEENMRIPSHLQGGIGNALQAD